MTNDGLATFCQIAHLFKWLSNTLNKVSVATDEAKGKEYAALDTWEIDLSVSSQRPLLNKRRRDVRAPQLLPWHNHPPSQWSWFVIAASPGSLLVFDWPRPYNFHQVECCYANASQGQTTNRGKNSDEWIILTFFLFFFFCMWYLPPWAFWLSWWWWSIENSLK